MLDHLWSLETIEDIEYFKASLPRFRRQQVDTLIELIRLQIIDDQIDLRDDIVFESVHDLLIAVKNTS